jgi:hydrogenase assembly chaperone HypC/HupF
MTAPSCENSSGCITCGDEGIPMRVVDLRDGEALCVDDQGATHEVAVDLVGAVLEGDRVLVHAGVAIGALA